jgi:hypothetical protein
MDRHVKKVNNWFHRVDIDGYSPYNTLQLVIDDFLTALKKRNNTIIIHERELRKLMCEATCVMYHAYITNKQFSGPNRIFPRPQEWTSELEEAWKFYIHSHCYDMDFWETFWNYIPSGLWEEDMPNWRYEIADILMYYIQPSIENMIESQILMEDDDGNYTPYADEDYE